MFQQAGKLVVDNIDRAHTEKKRLQPQFFMAVIVGDLQEIDRLIELGVDPNAVGDEGLTAVQLCTEQAHLLVLKHLLRHRNVNCNPHGKELNGDSPLMAAVALNRNPFVDLLLQHGADPNITNNFGRTPLHEAVTKQNIEMVGQLLFAKANPNVEDVFGNTPLSWSLIEYPCREMATLLLKWGANPNQHVVRPQPLLTELTLNCHSAEALGMVELLAAHKADMNVVNSISGQSALHMVSITGYLPLAELLLNLGAAQSLKDRSGRTPLDLAIQHGQADLVAFYKERNSLLKDAMGSTCLVTDRKSSEAAVAGRKPRNVRFSKHHATESED
ncbi:hypothetical protein HUJ04_008478 [Dendroctonus ponderosae]|uniref:Uncharacterized protein n=1 Tax=Dendroctonus ponderosae TaxID=77166 RepID=A0AAR5PZE4_DENPD|nr:hypothetical protein HUJ04_008478 [Dendroctonus ponderosae]